MASSRWQEDAARRNHIYQLTPKDERALAECQAEWQKFTKDIDATIGG